MLNVKLIFCTHDHPDHFFCTSSHERNFRTFLPTFYNCVIRIPIFVLISQVPITHAYPTSSNAFNYNITSGNNWTSDITHFFLGSLIECILKRWTFVLLVLYWYRRTDQTTKISFCYFDDLFCTTSTRFRQ